MSEDGPGLEAMLAWLRQRLVGHEGLLFGAILLPLLLRSGLLVELWWALRALSLRGLGTDLPTRLLGLLMWRAPVQLEEQGTAVLLAGALAFVRTEDGHDGVRKVGDHDLLQLGGGRALWPHRANSRAAPTLELPLAGSTVLRLVPSDVQWMSFRQAALQLGYTPCLAFLVAAGRLGAWHLLQVVAFGLALLQSCDGGAGASDELADLRQAFCSCILAQDLFYLICIAAGLCVRPAFLLYQPPLAAGRSWLEVVAHALQPQRFLLRMFFIRQAPKPAIYHFFLGLSVALDATAVAALCDAAWRRTSGALLLACYGVMCAGGCAFVATVTKSSFFMEALLGDDEVRLFGDKVLSNAEAALEATVSHRHAEPGGGVVATAAATTVLLQSRPDEEAELPRPCPPTALPFGGNGSTSIAAKAFSLPARRSLDSDAPHQPAGGSSGNGTPTAAAGAGPPAAAQGPPRPDPELPPPPPKEEWCSPSADGVPHPRFGQQEQLRLAAPEPGTSVHYFLDEESGIEVNFAAPGATNGNGQPSDLSSTGGAFSCNVDVDTGDQVDFVDHLHISQVDGSFPLLRAAIDNHVSWLRSLLETRADPHRSNERSGNFALLGAVSGGHVKCMELLLAARANPDQCDARGLTSLLLAVQLPLHKGAECLARLLAARATPGLSNEVGNCPLLQAASRGDLDNVRLLLQARADPRQSDEAGANAAALPTSGGAPSAKEDMFPLLAAAAKGHLRVMCLLLEAQADPEQSNMTSGMFPLLPATRGGHDNSVRLLLFSRADASQADKFGTFPLLHAAREGHADCAWALLEAKASVDQSDKHGSLPLLAATGRDHVGCVRLFLEARADPMQTNPRGLFPLLLAAKHGRVECLRVLLRARANARQTDGIGSCPLLFAAEGGHASCLHLLLQARADPKQREQKTGSFPLLVAARGCHSGCIRLLLEARADVEQSDRNGQFPLLVAVGRVECVRLLLEARASPGRSDLAGNTPLMLQAARGSSTAYTRRRTPPLTPGPAVTAPAAVRRASSLTGAEILASSANGLQLLLEAQASPEQCRPQDGDFPLAVAARFGQLEHVRLLLEWRATPWRRNARGETAMQISRGQSCAHLLLMAQLQDTMVTI